MRDEPPSSSERSRGERFSAAWSVAAFSFSAYGGLVVARISVSGAAPSRTTSRAASTAIDTASSSKLATARWPRPAPKAERWRREYGR
jgi:hypothetical protein